MPRPPGGRPCRRNVVEREGWCGNLFPMKGRDTRIDAAVALMMAVGRATEAPAQEGSILDRAELWTA